MVDTPPTTPTTSTTSTTSTTPSDRTPARRWSRRSLLAAAGGVVLAGGGVAAGAYGLERRHPARPGLIMPDSPLVAATEARRYWSGRTVEVDLLPRLGSVDLAGRRADTWLYNDVLPGPEIRLRAGDKLRASVVNALPTQTSVHWHGIRLRCDMDGVPGMTEPPLEPEQQFVYDFITPDPGTYWYHSHVGVQRDRGLYGALIVEDPHDPGALDADLTVVVDDWLDGLGTDPDAVLARLLAGQDTGITAMAMAPASPWGPMLGSIEYPLHLLNGRPAADPVVWRRRPGDRVRLRLINAGADTDYRIALDGHRLTVVATDGWAVRPVTVDTLLIAKGERYDVEVTLESGVWALVAAAEGKRGVARAILRTAPGALPPADLRPAALTAERLTYPMLHPGAGTELPAQRPEREIRMLLGRDASVPFRWTIDGAVFPHTPPVMISPGERIRVTFVNPTDMEHPMHLHGHTFALVGSPDVGGRVRKDSIAVLPGQSVAIDIQGDNPGQWMFHCHDEYHLAAGMATILSYQT